MLIVLKSGRFNLLEPTGPVQACNGIALPFAFDDQIKTVEFVATLWFKVSYCWWKNRQHVEGIDYIKMHFSVCILLGLSSNLCQSAWLICVYQGSLSSYVVNNFPRYTDTDNDHQEILSFYATGKVFMLYTKSLHANPWRTRCGERVHLWYLY